jgi:hypothetical protein
MNIQTFYKCLFLSMLTCQTLKAEVWDFSRAYLDYNFGQYINIKQSYTDLELFMPVIGNQKNIIALDAQGVAFNDGRGAFSGGIVARKCVKDRHVVGANVFYDYLKADCNANFNRIGIGGEFLSHNYDIRLNGYFHAWKDHHKCDSCVFDEIGNGYYAKETKYISAYRGFDAEVGRTLWENKKLALYGALGPYYYHQKCLYTFWGGAIRLEFNYKSFIYLKARASFDHAYHANVQGIIGISIPLDFNFKNEPMHNRCQENFLKRVQRLGIILTESFCDWTWNWND